MFALERWNPLKPGQKSSEIAENIPHQIILEEVMEEWFKEILRTEAPVQ